MESIRACYRLLVMIGTLVVLGLAYVAYGPPVDELGPLCRRAGDMVAEAIAQWQNEAPLSDTQRLALTPMGPADNGTADNGPTDNGPNNNGPARLELANRGQSPVTAIASSWPIEPNRVTLATAIEPSTPDDPMQQMITELNGLGMGSHKLHRWGEVGELYRFSCRMSCPGQAVMQQHFEAIASEPAAAVANVLGQVRAVR